MEMEVYGTRSEKFNVNVVERLEIILPDYFKKIGVDVYNKKVFAFNCELENEYGMGCMDMDVIEWHQLLGSSPLNTLKDSEYREEIAGKIDLFLSSLEAELEEVK